MPAPRKNRSISRSSLILLGVLLDLIGLVFILHTIPALNPTFSSLIGFLFGALSLLFFARGFDLL